MPLKYWQLSSPDAVFNPFEPLMREYLERTEAYDWNPDFIREREEQASLQIDWKETRVAHVFKANLPGVKKEAVKVEVKGGMLEISGERRKEEEEEEEKYHRLERLRGSFARRFRLPEDAKLDEVKVDMEDGVLIVTVPKHARVKEIEISG